MQCKKINKGFTLLEIMISLAILAGGIITLYLGHSQSVLTSARAEDTMTASMLAREKFLEYNVSLEKDMRQGVFPEEKEEAGSFEKPFEQFRWLIKIRKITIPLAGTNAAVEQAVANEKAEAAEEGVASDPALSNMGVSNQVAQLASQKISESLREIKIIVSWGEGKGEQKLEITSHLAKLR